MTSTNLAEVFQIKRLSICFWILAVLLSNIMCAVVAWNYCDLLWGINYAGYSAPASTAFLLAIPFAVGIAICIALALFFKKKSSQSDNSSLLG